MMNGRTRSRQRLLAVLMTMFLVACAATERAPNTVVPPVVSPPIARTPATTAGSGGATVNPAAPAATPTEAGVPTPTLIARAVGTTVTAVGTTAPAAGAAAPTAPGGRATPPYRDPRQPVEQRVEDLLGRMTLAEKIGQMTQVDKNRLTPADVYRYHIGALLSGGGGSPTPNTVDAWAEMVDGFQRGALATRLGIPLLYGVDAVHGHNNAYGATIFPHNIGLGAADDPALMEQIGRATALEMTAAGIRWNFAPVVAVPRDIRWGRTYEGYSEETARVSRLGVAYLRGLQMIDGRTALSHPLAVLATPKHFIGDGATRWGTSTTTVDGRRFQIDQGDMQLDEARLRAELLPPYRAVIEAGALCIMVSYNSWHGVKLHGHRSLLTDLLKGELGFSGFLVSDWEAIDQLPGDYYSDVVTSINAGVDLIMVPTDYRRFITTLEQAVQQGAVSVARIDDAVRRILRVKLLMGLFERPFSDPSQRDQLGNAAHRVLAREAVRRSLVLLTNQRQALPLAKTAPLIAVAGAAADDIGRQTGGWTIEWQGRSGPITPGTTILAGIKRAVGPASRVEYDASGRFNRLNDRTGRPLTADVGIAVVGEPPYAEGFGDSAELQLPAEELAAISRLRQRSRLLIVVLISGRPLPLRGPLAEADAVVAAWLPGSEGDGVADVLFGDHPFRGRLPYSWPRSARQLPFDLTRPVPTGCEGPLFPRGHGLTTAERVPLPPSCPDSG